MSNKRTFYDQIELMPYFQKSFSKMVYYQMQSKE
jgi:hypothetical protein